MIGVRRELAGLEAEWERVRPQRNELAALGREFERNRLIQAELGAWRDADLDWHEQMNALMRVAPPTVRLTRLRLVQGLSKDAPPARTFTMTLTGKVDGEKADANVQLLRRRLQESDATGERMENVAVKRYDADKTPGAGKLARVFQIECTYQPMELQ
jgi:hypothetical protein